LIICYRYIEFKTSDDFRDTIRLDYERIYSKRDFNLREIPIVLIVDKSHNKSVFNGYDLCIDDIGIDKLHLFIPDIISTIKTWRKAVLEELDSLGIKFKCILNISPN